MSLNWAKSAVLAAGAEWGMAAYCKQSENEPHPDQTNKMACAPSEDSAWASAQSDQSLHCLQEESLGPSYPLSAQWRLWSDWVDVQADMSLCWVHFCWFCHDAAQITFTFILEFFN